MANRLENRKYIRYDSGVTKVPEGEAENIETIKRIFAGLISGDFNKHGRMYPVTHAKTLGIVKGKLIVPHDLPKHLKQSMFATGGEYPVVLRYNTNNHDVGHDDRDLPSRGITIKIFNVNGDRFPEGEGNTTQDFEMNSTFKVAELADAKTAKEIISLLVNPATAKAEIAKRPDAALQGAPTMAPKVDAVGLSFFSQVPHRFGDYVGKHALIPVSNAQKALAGKTIASDEKSPEVVRNWLKQYYEKNEAEYEWQFQLLENLEEQPVEYAGKEWDSKKYPYQTVARLVFPKQDSLNYELKSYWEDNIRSNMWRGLKTLEPLGGTNRVRRAVYPFAGQMREKLNGRKVIDVQRIEEVPGPTPEGVPGSSWLGSWSTYLWSFVGK